VSFFRSLVDHIRVEHAILLEIMRNGVLREKGRLQPDFGTDPFALRMGDVGCMFTTPASAAVLRSKAGALKLIELPNLAPRGIASRTRNVNF
jgi:hypothetical protein